MKLNKNQAFATCCGFIILLLLALMVVATRPNLHVKKPSLTVRIAEQTTYTPAPFLPQPALQQAPFTLVYYNPVPQKFIYETPLPPEENITLPPVVLKPLANGVRPKIAIVIDDMGVNVRGSANILSLPAPLTLAFLPYGSATKRQAAQGLANGHELIVHMPMEPEGLAQNNPGPNALLVANGEAKNLKNVAANLAGFDGYVGVNNHMGSRFTANAKAMQPVLAELKKRGLFFLDSRTIGASVGGRMAQQMGLPFAVRDVFLDNVDNKQAVLAQLRQVEAIAAKRGYAVAIGHPHDGTYAALKAWLPTVADKNMQLVKLSELVTEP